MKLRNALLAGLCMASVAGIALPITASAATTVYFSVAPPPARYEVVPAPRHGYQWAPGYWNAKGKNHVWQKGHWERDRPGHYYAQPTWTQHDKGWQFESGRWNKGDRDHDGVPNTADRAPDNPTRR